MKKFLMSVSMAALLCGAAQAQGLTKDLYAAADMMTGVFSNREQATANASPLHREQTIVTRRVMRKDKESIWLYMAWYHPADRTTPLDHRVFELRADEAGAMAVQPYHIAAGASINELRKSDLRADVCTCALEELAEDPRFTYVFKSNSERWCESEVEGGMYKYVQLDFRFNDDGFSMFHSFYGADKSLLFGYPEGSHFKRIEE